MLYKLLFQTLFVNARIAFTGFATIPSAMRDSSAR